MPSRTVTIVVRALGATNAARQLRSVGGALGQVDRRGRRASRSIRGVGDAANRAASTSGYLASRAAGGLLAVGAAATVTGIKFNAMMERQVTAFSGFLGSTKAAKDYVQSLYSIAARTPFEFEDVLKGTRTLVAYGLAADEARTLFVGMGDAIAATGGGADQIRRASIALGQIQAAGVLHAQDLNQLIQAGVVSLPLLTKRMGTNTKAFRKDMKKNKIVSADFFEALQSSWENDPMYKGAAAKQAKTFYGQMEKLRDFSKQTLGTITEPMFLALRNKALPRFTRFSVDLNRIWKRDKLTLDEKLELSKASMKRRLGPLVDTVAEWWRSNEVGDKLAKAFESALTYVGNRLPGMLGRTIGAGFSAWMAMGPAGKAVTATLILTKLGLTRALLTGAGGLLGRLLFGGVRGAKGGMPAGTMVVNAGVVYVNGGVPGAGPGGRKGPGRIGRFARRLPFAAPLGAAAGPVGAGAAAAVGVVGGLAVAGRLQHGPRTPEADRRAGQAQARDLLGMGPTHHAHRYRNLGLTGHLQHGGPVRRSGEYEVGEAGPERVHLPQGAYVEPNRREVVIPISLNVDGKVLAQAVHRASLKRKSTR